MVNIKFKNLFLFIFLITFSSIIFNFEHRQTKEVETSSLFVEEFQIFNGFNDNIFNSYANFLIIQKIINNANILKFNKIHSIQPINQSTQFIITFDYSNVDERNNKLNEIKKEINLINTILKKELFNYLDNKAEYILLPEQTKMILNHYKNEKNYEFLYLNEVSKKIVKPKQESKARFIYYLILSILLSFIITFFLKLFLKNKKDLLTFFGKL